MKELEIKIIDIDKIKPNPFKIRETIDEKEKIEERKEIEGMAKTIKNEHIGLLQPIVVKKEKDKYIIISGERRWRACKLAGLKKIPVIIKDVSDSELMAQSLIENIHRKDLKPIEKAKGLAKFYKLAGVPGTPIVIFTLGKLAKGKSLTKEEEKIKEYADMVGLSYDYQYELLTYLKLTPEEQEIISKLELDHHKIRAIATIEKPEDRKKILEIAPELKREEVYKISKIIKKAPEPIKKEVLERKIAPEVAEKVLELPKEKQEKVVEEIKGLRLTKEEAIEHIEEEKEATKPFVLEPSEIERIRKDSEELDRELKEILSRPEVKERGLLFKNWLAHTSITGIEFLKCPICGKGWESFGWICHNINIKDAIKLVHDKYQESILKKKKEEEKK